MCSDDGRDDCQQLKPEGSHASFVTTVIAVTFFFLMLSILFSRVTVNVLVFIWCVVFFMQQEAVGAFIWVWLYHAYDTFNMPYCS